MINRKVFSVSFLLFIFLLVSVNASNQLTFYEDFGTETFKYTNLCGIIGRENFRYSNLSLGYDITKPTFNYNWKCYTDQIGGNDIISNTTANYYHTAVGLSINRGSGGSGNLETMVASEFDEPFYLTANDRISFYCRSFATETYLKFGTTNDEQSGIYVALYDGTGDACGKIGVSNSECFEGFSAFNNVCTNTSSLKYVNVSIQELMNADIGRSTNLTLLTYKWIGIEQITLASNPTFIDDLTIIYHNGTNELPDMDITFNNDVCFDPDKTTNIISFNYSVNDPENDQIYYGIDYTINKNINETIRYNEQYIGNFVDIPDYTFISNVYNDGTYCNIDTETYILNYSNFELIEYLIDSTPLIDYSKYMLALTSTCNGKSEYIYSLKNSIYNLFYATQIYGLQSQNEGFNLTLYDTEFHPQTKLKYIINNDYVVIYYYNHTITDKHGHASDEYFQLGNYSLTADPIEFSINDYGNETTGLLLDFTGNKQLTYRKITNDPIKYVGLEVSNGVIYQRYFTYSGISPTISFTTTPFNKTIEIDNKGSYNFNFYITDSVHLNSAYVKLSFNKFIPLCKYYSNTTYKTTDINNKFNPFNFFSNTFGVGLRGYLNTLGYYELAKSILWALFFGMFVFFTASQLMYTRQIDIVVPLLLSSGSCLFLSVMMLYSIGIISFIILFGIGVAMLLTPSFFGGGNGR